MTDKVTPILIVEREQNTRLFLIRLLENNNFNPILAQSTGQAKDTLLSEDVKLVLCDWDGGDEDDALELCSWIRDRASQNYVYVIVQSVLTGKDRIIRAMEAGADDFVSKPVNAYELLIRIQSCSRLIRLQEQLLTRNESLEFAHKRIVADYDQLTTELGLAASMQANLLPPPAELRNTYANWMFKPASFLAGDMFDYFMVSDTLLAFYVIDVEGHGTTSALTSFLVDNMLSPSREGLCRRTLENSLDIKNAVVSTVTQLNQKFSESDIFSRYFSMVYGVINTDTGLVTLTQAGHPYPIRYDSQKGCTELIGRGGIPVGILPGAEYEAIEFTLNQGDRLYLYSDGVTECVSEDGEMFDSNRLEESICSWQLSEIESVHHEFESVFRRWNGDTKPFEDDLSLICFEFRGGISQVNGINSYGI